MSDTNATDAEQTHKQPLLDRARESAEWPELGKISLAAVIGLAVNAFVVSVVTGGNFSGYSEGLMFLAPAVALMAALFHQYNPVEMSYIAPLILFISMLLANTLSLSVRVVRTFGPQSEPVMAVLIIGVVAAMFTPGPFLGAWAARRWWL